MDIEIIRRISLAKHLYELAVSSLRSNSDTYLFSAVNLLQDSVEAFLIALADHVNAAVDQNTKFDKYFVLIDEKIAPRELPFKSKLLWLNRIRVNSKHYGIQPARDECNRLAIAVHEFFDEVSSEHLGASFSTISAIDLLNDGETKLSLLQAKADLDKGDIEHCATNCRKAIFLEIEKEYDIAAYKDGKPLGFARVLTHAPFFALNQEYIDKNVMNPTDYIVYDHSHISQQLLTYGVDNTAFWNVWRLTPEVYKNKQGVWIVKHEFAKLDKKLLSETIEYIYSTTVDIILAIHRTRQAIKGPAFGHYDVTLSEENVPVFERADKNSRVIGTTPTGMLTIGTDFRVEGFEGDGPYWHIYHFSDKLMLFGFIYKDYVK